jgi:ketosteroid isomerase-like protein
MGGNVAIIRGVYRDFAKGDVPAVLGAFDAAIEWREADGFPYAEGNPYVGAEAIVTGVFQRVAADLDDFSVTPATVIDGGDTVVAEGRYRGIVKQTGKRIDAQFAHVWDLRNGKITRFQQYTDTKQWAEAFGA